MLELNKTSMDFDNVSFCAGILNNRDDRFHIHTLQVVFGVMTATDGYRLHLACVETVPNGYYRVVSKTKSKVILALVAESDVYSYPDVSVVLDQDDECKILDCIIDDEMSTVRAHALITKAMDEDECINYRFVSDIAPGDYTVEIRGRKPVMFINGSRKAAVMPARI